MATVSDDVDLVVVIPTAVNVVLLVNENVIFNLRKAQPSDLTLPSLYKRAFLILNETDEVAIARQGESTS
jgi:hypothetical protein